MVSYALWASVGRRRGNFSVTEDADLQITTVSPGLNLSQILAKYDRLTEESFALRS